MFAGLAHDALSAENAVIILQSARTPLIIDPSGQSSIWLQEHLKAKDTNHEVVPMQSDRCSPCCHLYAANRMLYMKCTSMLCTLTSCSLHSTDLIELAQQALQKFWAHV